MDLSSLAQLGVAPALVMGVLLICLRRHVAEAAELGIGLLRQAVRRKEIANRIFDARAEATVRAWAAGEDTAKLVGAGRHGAGQEVHRQLPGRRRDPVQRERAG